MGSGWIFVSTNLELREEKERYKGNTEMPSEVVIVVRKRRKRETREPIANGKIHFLSMFWWWRKCM